jgi:hypothetical protein
MLSEIRNLVADNLWLGALRKHRSRMGWRDAPKYSAYLNKARSANLAARDELTSQRADHFRNVGWSSFTDPKSHDEADDGAIPTLGSIHLRALTRARYTHCECHTAEALAKSLGQTVTSSFLRHCTIIGTNSVLRPV